MIFDRDEIHSVEVFRLPVDEAIDTKVKRLQLLAEIKITLGLASAAYILQRNRCFGLNTALGAGSTCFGMNPRLVDCRRNRLSERCAAK